jgi:hypothetical protein
MVGMIAAPAFTKIGTTPSACQPDKGSVVIP